MAVPLCAYFGKCGGCQAQHIDYSIQLENKRKNITHAIKFDDIKVFSDNEYYYRNRMDPIFTPLGLGFRKKGEWASFVDIEKCVISNEKLNSLIKEVKENFKDADYFDLRKKTGTFKFAVIRTPGTDSSISFVLNDESQRLTETIEKIKKFSEVSTANHIAVTYIPQRTDDSISENYFMVKGDDMLCETILDRKFYYSVQGFFQNNSAMAQKLHSYVNELLKTYETKNSCLLDLYGGVGTFGIINSGLFKEVKTVESFKLSTDSAKRNAEENNCKNLSAITLDAMQLKKLDLPKDLFVITDPPRSGMHQKTIERLKSLEPKMIIYVSCNYEQLGKELPKFKNYAIRSAALFDLFPQTNHSEAVVELVRKEII
jgi:23S rRNA (uracil1939-C5)-methyltransferase